MICGRISSAVGLPTVSELSFTPSGAAPCKSPAIIATKHVTQRDRLHRQILAFKQAPLLNSVPSPFGGAGINTNQKVISRKAARQDNNFLKRSWTGRFFDE